MTHTQPGPFAGPPPWPAVAPSTLPVVPRQYHEFWRAPAYRWWKGLLAALMGAVTWFFAIISLIFQVGLALVLAALLEEVVHQRLRGLLRTIYFIPATISITVAGILFSFIYNPQIGLLNRALSAVGLGSFAQDWLGNPGTAIYGVIAMSQWQSIGYTAVLFVVAMQRIPRELYEAAKVDGAGHVRTFFSITVPLLREMTTLVVILTLSGAFLVFNEVMVMTAGGPSNSSQVLNTWLYHNAFLADDMGYAAAIGTVIFVITFSISAAQILITRRRRVQW